MVKKILVVEDEEILNSIYSSELREEGFDTVPALNGRTALGILEKDKVDLMILDIKLPDMNGLQVLEELRKKNTSMPVIICSAYDPLNTGFFGKEYAGTEYMVKPVKLNLLKEKIRSLIG